MRLSAEELRRICADRSIHVPNGTTKKEMVDWILRQQQLNQELQAGATKSPLLQRSSSSNQPPKKRLISNPCE